MDYWGVGVEALLSRGRKSDRNTPMVYLRNIEYFWTLILFQLNTAQEQSQVKQFQLTK